MFNQSVRGSEEVPFSPDGNMGVGYIEITGWIYVTISHSCPKLEVSGEGNY